MKAYNILIGENLAQLGANPKPSASCADIVKEWKRKYSTSHFQLDDCMRRGYGNTL